MKRQLLLCSFVLLFQATNAQGWQDTVTIINKLFDRYKSDNPGCQLSISRNGEIIFSKAWGLADLENHVPFTTLTITEAGSISKQFTAAAVLLLEQQGKLSLDDDVRKYIPEIPDYGSVIRLKNLLHHTSGIREWNDLAAITGWPRTMKAYTNQDVLNLLCRQRSLNNRPGSEYIYSNSNYLLLAAIIERVSGMKLSEFTKKYVFEPAGMSHTSWRDNFKKIVPGRGIAYMKKDSSYEINMPNENVYGPGALLTTTDDLVKWAHFFLSNKLGSPGLLEKQLAIEKIPDGGETNYSAGLFISNFKGYKTISHTGQTAGYVGILESIPALKLSIAWLSNTTEFRDSLFDEIPELENLFIKKTLPEGNKKTVPVLYKYGSKTKIYAGWYREEKTNKGIKIGMRADTLLLNNVSLKPISGTDFAYKESEISFDRSGGFILTTTDKTKISFTKQVQPEITQNYLKVFAGTYYSKETESRFEVIFQKGKLFLQEAYLKDVVFNPTYNDAFNFNLDVDSNMEPLDANILFERSSKKTITGCQVSMSDARKIRFIKLQ